MVIAMPAVTTSQETRWWWLTFCPVDGDGCLGVAVVRAASAEDALRQAGLRGATPSITGSCRVMWVPLDAVTDPPAELTRFVPDIVRVRQLEREWYDRDSLARN